MNAASTVNKWIISLTTICACLMICMIAAAQMDPVYAGSHSSRQSSKMSTKRITGYQVQIAKNKSFTSGVK